MQLVNRRLHATQLVNKPVMLACSIALAARPLSEENGATEIWRNCYSAILVNYAYLRGV